MPVVALMTSFFKLAQTLISSPAIFYFLNVCHTPACASARTYACFWQFTSTPTLPRMFCENFHQYYSDRQFSLNAREYLRDKTDGVVSIHLSHVSPSSRGYNTGIDSQPSAVQ